MPSFLSPHRLLLATALLTAASVSMAHHSFNVDYDASRSISVTGTVTDVLFQNPHVEYYLEVAGEDGVERWNVQAQSVAALLGAGWNRDTFAPGDTMTATGFPSRRDAPRVYLQSARTADGRELALFDSADSRVAVATNPPSELLAADPAVLEALQGDWAFDVDKRLPGAPFRLTLGERDSQLTAVLDFEPVDAHLNGTEIVLFLDRENAGGFPVRFRLSGRLQDDHIAGTVTMVEGSTAQQNLDATRFTAVRSSEEFWQPPATRPPTPVDLSGTWRRTIGVGPLGRTNPVLTDAGRDRHALFAGGRYDPSLRCMTVGPMRKYADPGAVEILQDDDRITLLFASNHDVRRIWLNRDSHTPERAADAMGESIGYWDGSTLLLNTTGLSGNVLTHNAEPISPDAHIVERYWLEEDGSLTMEAVLHDPLFYAAPVTRRTQWVRDDSIDIAVQSCDPDGLYRGLFSEGALGEYFDNQPPPLQ